MSRKPVSREEHHRRMTEFKRRKEAEFKSEVSCAPDDAMQVARYIGKLASSNVMENPRGPSPLAMCMAKKLINNKDARIALYALLDACDSYSVGPVFTRGGVESAFSLHASVPGGRYKITKCIKGCMVLSHKPDGGVAQNLYVLNDVRPMDFARCEEKLIGLAVKHHGNLRGAA